MANWHDKACSYPDIILLPNLPACQSCGTLPQTLDVTQSAAKDQFLGSAIANDHEQGISWPRKDLQRPLVQPIDQEPHDSQTKHSTMPSADTAFASLPSEASIVLRPEGAVPPVNSRAPSPDSAIDVRSTQSSGDCGNCIQTGDPQPRKLQLFQSERVVYSSLASPDHIRVLNLHKGIYDDPIHFDLESQSLWNCADFEALSYTWADATGDNRRCQKIYTGRWWDEYLITKNCEAALRSIRSETEDKRLWVDAICINQNDVKERSRQVSLMRDIYATAWRVIVYLGDASSDSDIGLPLITEASNFGSFQESLYDRQKEASLWNLFERPYFSRVWVIQEITLARSIMVVCGKFTATSSRADCQLRRVAEIGYGPDWLKYCQTQGLPPEHLLSLLVRTRECDCADPRDKVFGLLGLIQYSSIEGLVPDYTLSLAQVYAGIAFYLVEQQGRIDILEHAGMLSNDRSKETCSLPSWVPDWSKPISCHNVRLSARQFQLSQKNNSAQTGVMWYSNISSQKPDGIRAKSGNVECLVNQYLGILSTWGTMLQDLSDCERRLIGGQEVIVHQSDKPPTCAAYIFAPCNNLPRRLYLFTISGWDRPALLARVEDQQTFRFVGECAIVFGVKELNSTKPGGHLADRLPLTSLMMSASDFAYLKSITRIMESSIWFQPRPFGSSELELWGNELTYGLIDLSQQKDKIEEEANLWENWKSSHERISWICTSVEGLQVLAAEIKELAHRGPHTNWRYFETACLQGHVPLNRWNIDRFVWSLLPTKPAVGKRMSHAQSRRAIENALETGLSLLQLLVEWGKDTASLLDHLSEFPPKPDEIYPCLPGSYLPSRWQACWTNSWDLVRGCEGIISSDASHCPRPGWRARTLLEITARELCQTDIVTIDNSTILPCGSDGYSNITIDWDVWDWDEFQNTMKRRQILLADALQMGGQLSKYASTKKLIDVRAKMLARGHITSLQWNFDKEMLVDIV